MGTDRTKRLVRFRRRHKSTLIVQIAAPKGDYPTIIGKASCDARMVPGDRGSTLDSSISTLRCRRNKAALPFAGQGLLRGGSIRLKNYLWGCKSGQLSICAEPRNGRTITMQRLMSKAFSYPISARPCCPALGRTWVRLSARPSVPPARFARARRSIPPSTPRPWCNLLQSAGAPHGRWLLRTVSYNR